MTSWFFIPVLTLATFFTLWAAMPIFVPLTRTYKHATDIRQLLNSPRSPLEDLLRARAIPNKRLVDAFRITSTFVSEDTKTHKTFTTRAKALIAPAGDKNRTWRTLALSAKATVHRFLPAENNADFSALVQCITFSVVLSTLFHTDLDQLRYEDVMHVTNIINQRWKDSKIKNGNAMRQDQGSLDSLLAHIKEWIDHERFPNPMNFILPSYETLWRVVAVTVAYIYCCRDNTLHDVVVTFSKDPTEERFVAFGEDGWQPSMQAIILEVLRLHPPTRHIVRASRGTSLAGGPWWQRMLVVPAIEVADVEGAHLSDDFGENTSTFDPMRFHPSRMPERPEMFSFGYGRLKCVAAGWAPMAAALIAARIVRQIEEMGYMVTVGPKIGGRSGWEGWVVYRKAE